MATNAIRGLLLGRRVDLARGINVRAARASRLTHFVIAAGDAQAKFGITSVANCSIASIVCPKSS
jgi:hypothetical protein